MTLQDVTESDRRQREIVRRVLVSSTTGCSASSTSSSTASGCPRCPSPTAPTADSFAAASPRSGWQRASPTGVFSVRAESESQIVRGLASLLVRVYDWADRAEGGRRRRCGFRPRSGSPSTSRPTAPTGSTRWRRAIRTRGAERRLSRRLAADPPTPPCTPTTATAPPSPRYTTATRSAPTSTWLLGLAQERQLPHERHRHARTARERCREGPGVRGARPSARADARRRRRPDRVHEGGEGTAATSPTCTSSTPTATPST